MPVPEENHNQNQQEQHDLGTEIHEDRKLAEREIYNCRVYYFHQKQEKAFSKQSKNLEGNGYKYAVWQARPV